MTNFENQILFQFWKRINFLRHTNIIQDSKNLYDSYYFMSKFSCKQFYKIVDSLIIWGASFINLLSRGERNLMKANLLHTWVGFENETKPNCREFSGGRLNAASFCDWERVNSSIILSHNVTSYFLRGFLIFSSSLSPYGASRASKGQ